MAWLDELAISLDLKRFFPTGKPTGADQININCPYHDDQVASMSINTRRGMFYCHACGKRGNFITWAIDNNIDLMQLSRAHEITEQNYIDRSVADDAHKKLMANKKVLGWLKDKRGLTLATIKKFNLGVFERNYTIPIYDLAGNLVNIRVYNPTAQGSQVKYKSWQSGHGEARLFPIGNIKNDPVMICEGEFDAMLADQMGFNAVTSTTGAKSFKKEWIKLFSSKNVILCYDIDQAGIEGAAKTRQMLKGYAESIKTITLPLDKNKYPTGDFTDYIVKEGHTKDDFKKLLEQALQEEAPSGDQQQPALVHEVTLEQASNAKYNNENIIFKALVSGKSMNSFFIPKKVQMTCAINAGNGKCPYCPMSQTQGRLEGEIQVDDRMALGFYDCNDRAQETQIKKAFNVQEKCMVVNIDILESYNLEEVVLVPEIEYTTNVEEDENYVVREAIYLGHNINTNKAYQFKGITTNHPKTQTITHLLTEARPAMTILDSYEFTEAKYNHLARTFQSDNVYEKLKDIYQDTVIPVSGIKGRLELFIAVMLTYCSPLHFMFEGRMIKKGWLETLVLGDTRTGKTEMLKSLIEYFKAGELVLGESASFAGLVGGLQQGIGNQWHLTWGRIPLNNRRLVVVDEMSGLAVWEIGKLSGIRSSGIAEITKIRTERTFAKTRLIWLSNPRGSREEQQRLLASYSQGVRAVPELIGKPEDISRFDVVLMLGADDISRKQISEKVQIDRAYKYKSQDFNDLIMWSWKLHAKEIKFNQGLETTINKYADAMAHKYDQSIPLVMKSEQHIKIARLAAAAAALNYSSPDGKMLLVEERHVKFAFEYLNKIFDKPICSYNEYSRLEKARYSLKNEEEIKEIIKRNPGTVDQLLDLEKITQSDLQEILDIESRSDLRKELNTLIANRALRRATQGYIKTPAFIRFLRQHKNGKFEPKAQPAAEVPEVNDDIDNEDWWSV